MILAVIELLTKSQENEHKSTAVKDQPNIVQLLDFSPSVSTAMDLLVSRREIEEEEQKSRESTGDDIQIIIPSPLLLSVSHEVLGDDRTEGGKGEGGDEEAAVDDRTGLVGHQLRDHEGESKLDGTREPSQDGASNYCRYVVCSAADYGSN